MEQKPHWTDTFLKIGLGLMAIGIFILCLGFCIIPYILSFFQ